MTFRHEALVVIMHPDPKAPGGQKKLHELSAQPEGKTRVGNVRSVTATRLSGSQPNPSGNSDGTNIDADPIAATWLAGGSAILNVDGRIVAANDTLATWCGVSPGKLQGRPFAKLLGDRHAEWEPPVQELLRHKAQFDRLELVSKSPSTTEWLNLDSCLEGSSRFIRMESILQPLQELENCFPDVCWGRVASHSAFQRLLSAETRLENLIRRWPAIVFSQRPDLSFAFISPKVEELTGMPVREWKNSSLCFLQVIHEADAEPFLARLRNEAGSQAEMMSAYRVRHIKTGHVTYIQEHRFPVRDKKGSLISYEGIWLDITRLTIAERRLLSMAWKENLCTLTLGLTHDFCNIMTGIVSLSESYGSSLEEGNPLRGGLDMIRTSAAQAGQLAQRIRQLHQGITGEKNYHDLNEVVSNMVEILQKVLSKRVRIQMALHPEPLPVYLDAVELQQVVANLALNAMDAMPNGGQITIRTERHESTSSPARFQGTMPRPPLVSLSMQDTGDGIPQRLLNSIFDPFFTTKPLGKGSGLGLYNTRVFVEKHGAAISVDSSENFGTTFHLWFPLANFTEAGPVQPALHPARHTLLLVGQPGETMNKMAETLRGNGFYVVPTASDADALEQIHSPHYQFTGVLLLTSGASRENQMFVRRLRLEKIPVKTICVVGGNQDEVETSLIEQVDAVVPADMPVPDFLSKLKSVLNEC